MYKELQNLGLSEKEARVYVAALELGKATVQQISKKAQVNRATTYVQLESLKDRGLVSQSANDKKSFYVAESPDKVEQIVENEKMNVLFKEKELNKVLPGLKAIFNVTEDRPNVRFFEGEEGREAYRKESRKKIKIVNILLPYLKDDFNFDTKTLELFNVDKFYIIYISDKVDKQFENFAKKRKGLFVKRISKSKLDMKTEIAVFDNQIWINKLVGKGLGIVIEDKVIAQGVRKIFELLWQTAK